MSDSSKEPLVGAPAESSVTMPAAASTGRAAVVQAAVLVEQVGRVRAAFFDNTHAHVAVLDGKREGAAHVRAAHTAVLRRGDAPGEH